MPRYSVMLKTVGGGSAVICGSRPMQACICGYEISAYLCDFPVDVGKTCDAPLGADCRVNKGPELDYCPEHAKDGVGQERLI